MTLDEVLALYAEDREGFQRWEEMTRGQAAYAELVRQLAQRIDTKIAAYLDTTTYKTAAETILEQLIRLATQHESFSGLFDVLYTITKVIDGRKASDKLLGL